MVKIYNEQETMRNGLALLRCLCVDPRIVPECVSNCHKLAVENAQMKRLESKNGLKWLEICVVWVATCQVEDESDLLTGEYSLSQLAKLECNVPEVSHRRLSLPGRFR